MFDLMFSQGVTGEEDETISAEVKGAKLFTKHGRKDFTSGMYGHIKYLASKTSHSKDKADRDEDQIEHEHRINTETRTRLRKLPTSRAIDLGH